MGQSGQSGWSGRGDRAGCRTWDMCVGRRLAALAGRAGEAPAQRVRQVASRCSAPGHASQPPSAAQMGQQRELEHAGVSPAAARPSSAPRRLARPPDPRAPSAPSTL